MSKNKNIFTNQPSRARKLLAAGAATVVGGAGVYGLTQTNGSDTPKNGRNDAVCVVPVKDGDTVNGILHKLGVSNENKLDVVDPITGKTVSNVEQESHLLPGMEVVAMASAETCQAIGAKVLPIHVEDPRSVRETLREMTPES